MCMQTRTFSGGLRSPVWIPAGGLILTRFRLSVLVSIFLVSLFIMIIHSCDRLLFASAMKRAAVFSFFPSSAPCFACSCQSFFSFLSFFLLFFLPPAPLSSPWSSLSSLSVSPLFCSSLSPRSCVFPFFFLRLSWMLLFLFLFPLPVLLPLSLQYCLPHDCHLLSLFVILLPLSFSCLLLHLSSLPRSLSQLWMSTRRKSRRESWWKRRRRRKEKKGEKLRQMLDMLDSKIKETIQDRDALRAGLSIALPRSVWSACEGDLHHEDTRWQVATISGLSHCGQAWLSTIHLWWIGPLRCAVKTERSTNARVEERGSCHGLLYLGRVSFCLSFLSFLFHHVTRNHDRWHREMNNAWETRLKCFCFFPCMFASPFLSSLSLSLSLSLSRTTSPCLFRPSRTWPEMRTPRCWRCMGMLIRRYASSWFISFVGGVHKFAVSLLLVKVWKDLVFEEHRDLARHEGKITGHYQLLLLMLLHLLQHLLMNPLPPLLMMMAIMTA